MLITSSSPFESQTFEVDHSQYIMDANNKIVEMRKGGRFDQSIILKYEDDSEWIFLNNKPEERFCGYLYLQNAISESNLNNVQAAENKIAIHNRKIIYLSRYYGDKKPEFMELFKYNDELSVLTQNIGFTDVGGNANLRVNGNKVYVFDTERGSFDKKVHEKIDSFVQQHNEIRSVLEVILGSGLTS